MYKYTYMTLARYMGWNTGKIIGIFKFTLFILEHAHCAVKVNWSRFPKDEDTFCINEPVIIRPFAKRICVYRYVDKSTRVI